MVELVSFLPECRKAFHDLNLEWLETYFHVEPYDIEQLKNPERIIENGGEIWFALVNGEPVGTGALYRKRDGEFEIAKMAVKPELRGHGIGAEVLEKLIERFVARGGTRLILATNANLEAAIRLYRRYGFEDYQPEEPPEYERANVFMEWRGDLPAGD